LPSAPSVIPPINVSGLGISVICTLGCVPGFVDGTVKGATELLLAELHPATSASKIGNVVCVAYRMLEV
jgi:hypothetical protein